ncbi:hypothetical protein D3C80_1679860 [compost metagenome]
MTPALQMVAEDIVHHIAMVQRVNDVAKTGLSGAQRFALWQVHDAAECQPIGPGLVADQHFQCVHGAGWP